MSLLQALQTDLRTLANETRKKHPHIREACEEAIEKMKDGYVNPQTVVNQILYPLVQGCESKDIKIIKFCLGLIQRLIAQQGIDTKGARHIVDCLSDLAQSSVLELKLLQTAALLMTSSDHVHGDSLARTLGLCMRMVPASESRDASTNAAAAATVRQLVALVFEQALLERDGELKVNPADARPVANCKAPKDLKPCAADAYLIFQDIIQLINGDAAHWLVGINEIPKTFGLELLDTVLTDFSPIFFKITEFRFLLKEHVCALIIRLFSPNVKYRAAFTSLHIPGAQAPSSGSQAGGQASPPGPDRPHYPVSMRLLHLVSVIIHKYHSILVTECEIFLSLTIKFLDPDKPLWQRALALEVLHKMTIRPQLLSSFCECYDLRPHATNIFQDIVNALGAYVQSLFVASQVNTPVGASGIPQQSGFYWKGVWLPLCVTFEPGTAKSTYLEMLDRTEAPVIQDGYGISVAYACLMETVRSIAITVEGAENFKLQESCANGENPEKEEVNSNRAVNGSHSKGLAIKADGEIHQNAVQTTQDGDQNFNTDDTEIGKRDKEKTLHLQLIKSSWCGLVWGLSVLAEASVGELENILQGIQTLARISGKVGHSSGRDACISALCRAALPAHYCLPALGALPCPWRGRDGVMLSQAGSYSPETDYRHQVVCVGTPLPSASMPVGQQQSFVMVTARHVTAMKALLWTAQRDGDTIQQAWLPVLTTLQHLVWILGLKPSTGGSMKAGKGSADANSVMSTSAVMADLPSQQMPVAELLNESRAALSSMLSKVFESSKNLDDVALHHLIDALCKLSNEAMELAYSNREPSLFAVAKLLETGLANLHRVEVMWRPITNHLLEVCQHPHIRMREWGVEAITYLVKTAFDYHHKNPQLLTENRERLLLEPLAELCSVRHCDVRARQLVCAAQLLDSHGAQLGAAWPLMMNIIAAIHDHHSKQLISSAFQCVQLVAPDLLNAAGPRCLHRVLAAAAAFAHQSHDLNISLTAVGLMWNISDHLHQNRDKLNAALAGEPAVFPELPDHASLPHLDKLWMCLYIRLSELCTEPRAPVRRAASQTLFSCIGAHGGQLTPAAWRPLLSAVLLSMLHKVQSLSNVASSEKVDTGEHILIHHTRNTAQKQWAETQVLTLSGVSRVFYSRFHMLCTIGDFTRYWSALLEFITDFALRKSHEVSLAALKSFQEVLSAAGRTPDTGVVSPSLSPGGALHKQVWSQVWRCWINIASGAAQHAKDKSPGLQEEGKPMEVYAPSQGFLATIVQIFPVIFQNLRTGFTTEDVARLGECLSGVCAACATCAPSLMMDSMNAAPVHTHALHCMDLVQREALSRHELLSPTFRALTVLSTSFASRDKDEETEPCSARIKCLTCAVRLYRSTATQPHVEQDGVLASLVKSLQDTAVASACERDKRRRSSQSACAGAQAASLLQQVLATGLPLAREKPERYESFWNELPGVLDCFMFQAPVGGGETAKELVLLIRTEILDVARSVPRAPAAATLALLRKGSSHGVHHNTDSESELKGREEFARTCFETLLQFSMLDDVEGLTDAQDESDPLAVLSLLERFQEIVVRCTLADDTNTDKLPRQQLSELSFVLKAIATLADSMKKAPVGKVDSAAWQKLIGLYPHLVALAASSHASEASSSLKEALMQYADLITQPRL